MTGALCKLAKEWGCSVREDTVAPGETTIDLAAYVQPRRALSISSSTSCTRRVTSTRCENYARTGTLLRTVAELLNERDHGAPAAERARVILRESELDDDHLHLSLEERTALADSVR